MSHYLDASVIVSIFVEEARSQLVANTLGAVGTVPYLSDYGTGEVASAISRHVRIGTFTAEVARSVLDDFDQWVTNWAGVIPVETRDIQRASQIVRRFDLKLKLPDALHITICDNRGLTLVTGDAQMASAASTLNLDVKLIA